jgi:hypothetical protein
MQVTAARGIILEELVLYLLTLVGYRVVRAGEEGTHDGHSGLEVHGRGEWHQIDALAAFDRTPAFMYPLRLMVEAKCYARGRPVGIEVTRNAVGVLKDISENYFTYQPLDPRQPAVQIARFNYHSAIFSTSGYTAGAQRYAIAHQIFLIQYESVSLLEPVINGLLALQEEHFVVGAVEGNEVSSRLRKEVRDMLARHGDVDQAEDSVLTEEGFNHVLSEVVRPLMEIQGSYFGMLQGKWPLHLLAKSPLPERMFTNRDEVPCRVYGRDSPRWSFVPTEVNQGEEGWFRLEFDIPEEVVGFVRAARENPITLAEVKQANFSFLDVVGKIGGIQRQVRLRLDEDWLGSYVQRLRRRQA